MIVPISVSEWLLIHWQPFQPKAEEVVGEGTQALPAQTKEKTVSTLHLILGKCVPPKHGDEENKQQEMDI